MAALMHASRAGSPAFLNGGAGEEDAARLHALSKEYSLRIEFAARKNDESMAVADVEIADIHGKLVFHLAAAGPITLVHLAPGTYRVTARTSGRGETQTATIESHGTSTLCFHRHGGVEPLARLHPSSVAAGR